MEKQPDLDLLLTISSTNKTAPFDPTKLLLQGFYLFPVYGYRKYPTKLGGKACTWYWDHSELQVLAAEAAVALTNTSLTGWAICPHKDDYVPLLLIDVDDYANNRTNEETWQELTNSTAKPPKGTGFVSTPSGGTHVWLRMPAHVAPSSIPHAFDLGNGIKGEIRFSGQEGAKFLVMPGTRSLNKQDHVGRYEATTEFNLATLPEAPPDLIARLQNRLGTSEVEDQEQVTDNNALNIQKSFKNPPTRKEIVESQMPTEFHHLLMILENCSVAEGGRNNFAAAVAQIVGRFYRKRPNETAMKLLENAIQKTVDPPMDSGELKRTLFSAIKKGQVNSKKHDEFTKHPSMTLVLTEARAIFQSIPWLLVHLNSEGRPVAYEIGVGGSAAAKDSTTRSVTVMDFTIQSVLAGLSKLSGADPDVVVRSPIFIAQSWAKVLMHWLRTTAEYEYVSLPTEAVFWDTVQQWALEAADGKSFSEGLSLKQEDKTVLCHTTAAVVDRQMTDYRRLVLIIHPRAHEFLLMSCGDIGATKKLIRSYVDERRVLYPRKSALAWCVEVNEENMGEETMAYIWSRYTDYKTKGQEE